MNYGTTTCRHLTSILRPSVLHATSGHVTLRHCILASDAGLGFGSLCDAGQGDVGKGGAEKRGGQITEPDTVSVDHLYSMATKHDKGGRPSLLADMLDARTIERLSHDRRTSFWTHGTS